ncbi:MAG: radical SAM protein [Elusimicrobia bacterium]|nr:radical SAM protein [Elusimicrobiota bacterium]
MKTIILVNPPLSVQERYGGLSWAGGVEPPFGLCYLASVLRENGYPVTILDAQALKLSAEATIRHIVEENPDVIGLTAVTSSVSAAAFVVAQVKSAIPRISAIVGGAHVSAMPRETLLRFPQFDAGVIGEGEQTILELIPALHNSDALRSVAGIIFQDHDSLIINPPRAYIPDLDTLPMPAFDLLPELATHYTLPLQSVSRLPSVSLITSRGCVGKCAFCDHSVFGNQYRSHSPEYIFSMIKVMHDQYSIREILFEDDNFLVNKSRVRKLIDLIQKGKLDLRWSCLTTISPLDPDLLKEMKNAGCWQILLGIESGSQCILDILEKQVAVDQIRSTIESVHAQGIKTKGFVIAGSPGETRQTLAQTRSLILSAPLDDVSITFFVPYTGTALYPQIASHGAFDDDWIKSNQFQIVFLPKGITSDELADFVKGTYRMFYFRLRIIFSYVQRCTNISIFGKYIAAGFAFIKYSIRTKNKTYFEVADRNSDIL